MKNNVTNEKYRVPTFDEFFESLLNGHLMTGDDFKVKVDSTPYRKTGNDVHVEDIKND